MSSFIFKYLLCTAITIFMIDCFYHKAFSKSNHVNTILDLQSYQKSFSHTIKVNKSVIEIRLINLNQNINSWFLVAIKEGNRKTNYFHLENTNPDYQTLNLNKNYGKGIIITETSSMTHHRCQLWSLNKMGFNNSLVELQKSKRSYVPLCNNRLYLRNKLKGRKTTKEWVTQFLRENIFKGDEITNIVKKTFFEDKYLITSYLKKITGKIVLSSKNISDKKRGPLTALVDAKRKKYLLTPRHLGIALKKASKQGLHVGKWYEAKANPNIYISAITPKYIDRKILTSHMDRVAKLDRIERNAYSYLVAFDLDFYQIGFSLGTDHPKVGWSQRVRSNIKNQALKGPDGFSTIKPLVSTGKLSPQKAKRAVATFTGGFRRRHGGFKWGKLAAINNGSHYGFVENGVVFSRLQPGLATLLIKKNGYLTMKTWDTDEASLNDEIRYARQNGVAIIEYDSLADKAIPSKYVNNWMYGNWSGSAKGNLRSLRAGICLMENQGKRFLIYAYFSSSTPSAMARVFQAYHCTYAMHLDMNAPEHTYLATYIRKPKQRMLLPEHLTTGMAVLDDKKDGVVIPRFLGYQDNRDYFFVLKKPQQR